MPADSPTHQTPHRGSGEKNDSGAWHQWLVEGNVNRPSLSVAASFYVILPLLLVLGVVALFLRA